MDQSACFKLQDLLDRLDVIASAYSSLSWFAACSAEVPADRVGCVMVPLDDAFEALRSDFRAFLQSLRETS